MNITFSSFPYAPQPTNFRRPLAEPQRPIIRFGQGTSVPGMPLETEYRSGVSSGFLAAAQAQISELPQSLLTKLIDAKVKIIIAPTLEKGLPSKAQRVEGRLEKRLREFVERVRNGVHPAHYSFSKDSVTYLYLDNVIVIPETLKDVRFEKERADSRKGEWIYTHKSYSPEDLKNMLTREAFRAIDYHQGTTSFSEFMSRRKNQKRLAKSAAIMVAEAVIPGGFLALAAGLLPLSRIGADARHYKSMSNSEAFRRALNQDISALKKQGVETEKSMSDPAEAFSQVAAALCLKEEKSSRQLLSQFPNVATYLKDKVLSHLGE